MAGVFAGEALSGMIWAILRELDSDTLTESQSGLFPPCRELRENYAKTA